MTTRAEARQLAGELLRLTPINQPLQSQHDTRMDEAYIQVKTELENLEIEVWDEDDEMDDSVVSYFIALMAHNKMNLYGISDSLYTRIVNKVGVDGQIGRSAIKGLLNAGYFSPTEPTDF